MNNDPDFSFPSSSTHKVFYSATNYHQNPRKKRSKLMRNDPTPATTGSSNVIKPKNVKKPDSSTPKITPPCSECGRRFWSYKALFGHMRCHPERQWRGINPPPHFRRPMSPVKGVIMTEEDNEIATCLLMLADGIAKTNDTTSSQRFHQEHDDVFVGNEMVVMELDDMGFSGSNCGFECSSCRRVFSSHQALGGHRASHKTVMGCFATAKGESKVGEEGELDIGGHKCSICLRVFSSGQALGGHKRCHWDKEEGSGLDLNLPAQVEDDSSFSFSSGLTLDLRLGL